MVWMQIAKMLPNGYALILGNRNIQLKGSFCKWRQVRCTSLAHGLKGQVNRCSHRSGAA